MKKVELYKHLTKRQRMLEKYIERTKDSHEYPEPQIKPRGKTGVSSSRK